MPSISFPGPIKEVRVAELKIFGAANLIETAELLKIPRDQRKCGCSRAEVWLFFGTERSRQA